MFEQSINFNLRFFRKAVGILEVYLGLICWNTVLSLSFRREEIMHCFSISRPMLAVMVLSELHFWLLCIGPKCHFFTVGPWTEIYLQYVGTVILWLLWNAVCALFSAISRLQVLLVSSGRGSFFFSFLKKNCHLKSRVGEHKGINYAKNHLCFDDWLIPSCLTGTVTMATFFWTQRLVEDSLTVHIKLRCAWHMYRSFMWLSWTIDKTLDLFQVFAHVQQWDPGA